MAYVAPSTVTTLQTYTSAAHNIIVNDVIDHETRIANSEAAWTAWTPTWGGLTIGNATVQARYLKVGKTVWFNVRAVLGSTSSVSGDISFTLPVTGTTSISSVTVYGQFIDASPLNVYPLVADAGSAQVALRAIGASGTYAIWAIASSTVPFTWATNDTILCSGFYEAA